ncbi:MAG: leucine-rich repeat domain-containing protein [Burkholderiaceae bacterium]|nr:leucine-rich repeat domain-containing protein [Burkholderiaceae bacterium]
MSIKLVIALILAIPTYGASLVLLVGYKFYQAARAVNSVERALLHLSAEGTGWGTCFSEISYLQAKTFLDEKGEFIEAVNLHRTYLLGTSGTALRVQLDKEPQGRGAIFRVVSLDWLVGLQQWARAGNLPERNIGLLNLYNLEAFTDNPYDSSGNPLLDNEIVALPPNFDKLPKLQKLWLSGKSFASLAPTINKFQSLRVLHVSESIEIPAGIGSLECLESLQFSHGSVERIPSGIGALQSLTHLGLDNNRILSVPSSIGDLKGLWTLDLRRNRIQSLPDSITANDTIQALLLGDNQLSELPRFPKRPNKYKYMSTIDLGFNQFETIPEAVLEIDDVFKLIMCGNPMTSLPMDLSRLKVSKLLVFGEQKHLKLAQNQIEWLKHQSDKGCEIWLACDALVLGDVDKWKTLIGIRMYN